MPTQGLADILIRAFEAAGADDGLTYVSVPITSGLREATLAVELGLDPRDVPQARPDLVNIRVIAPNEADAREYAAAVRKLYPESLVVEPARLLVPGWGQDDYLGFWKRLIEKYAQVVVAAPGWAFSRGARLEIGLALKADIPIVDVSGSKLDSKALEREHHDALAVLVRVGLTTEQAERYLSTTPGITT